MHHRLLAIDYGDVRIGVAISDPLGLTAQPVGIIQNGPKAIHEIIQIIREKNIAALVVGLPKNQRGDDSDKATDVRNFVDALLDQYTIKVTFVDERFSTVAAQRMLHGLKINTKKQRRILDTQAAMFILQGVLDAR
jgi:putative Holliday junction resolvase